MRSPARGSLVKTLIKGANCAKVLLDVGIVTNTGLELRAGTRQARANSIQCRNYLLVALPSTE